MPPKRKRGGGTAAARKGGKRAKTSDDAEMKKAPAAARGRGGRKVKRDSAAAAAAVAESSSAESDAEPESPPTTTKQIIEKLKKSDKKKRTPKIDPNCNLFSAVVYEDFDCMLNQTNIGNNNNKFYIIQLIQCNSGFHTWTRWGRVGETGKYSLSGRTDLQKATADFEKKFKDKTKNNWQERDSFVAVAGKYTLLDMIGDDDEDDDGKSQQVKCVEPKEGDTLPCTLDKPTQSLIKLLFDNDMFQEALKNLEIDIKKMPLGKISKTQIAKGFEVLEKLQDAIKTKKSSSVLAQISSEFYTLIPHSFGRQRPPTISDLEMLQTKMDLLTVLGDIEVAQAIQKENKSDSKKDQNVKPQHPLDSKYGLLTCDLKHLDIKSDVGKILAKYVKATENRKLEILDVWEVNRHKEGDHFAVNSKIENRKLLWHGTNVAVVVAILKGGLRIMPHSGGRVGKGIYFASENAKSAGYVRTTQDKTGIMFLNEVVLGKEHHITVDDWTLVAPPKGFDSIVAKGITEPDPKLDTEIVLDGHKVTVPQGKPIRQNQFQNSRFSQSEYLVYREDQCRIRYLLKLKF